MVAAGQIIRTSDVPRVVGWLTIDANTTSVSSGSDTVVLTMTNVTFENGRAYEVEISSLYNISVTTARGQMTIHKTNAAGANYIDFHQWTTSVNAINNAFTLKRILLNTSGSDVTMDLALCLKISSGAGTVDLRGSTTSSCGYWKVVDVGSADDYPGLNTVS